MAKKKKKPGKETRETATTETGEAAPTGLAALEEAVAALEGEDEADEVLDFEEVLAQVKRDICQHQEQRARSQSSQAVSGGASSSTPGAQTSHDDESSLTARTTPAAGTGTRGGSSNNDKGRRHQDLRRRLSERIKHCKAKGHRSELAASEDTLEAVTYHLFTFGVLNRRGQVQAFKAQLLNLLERAEYSAAEAAVRLPDMFLSFSANIWRHRRACVAAPIFHERVRRLAGRLLRDSDRYRPFPVRRLGEFCSIGAQARVVERQLQAKAEVLMNLQLQGRISAARAQVKWEEAKAERGACGCTLGLLDVACGAIVCEDAAELNGFVENFNKQYAVVEEGLRITGHINGFALGLNDLIKAFDGTPHTKIHMELVGQSRAPWVDYICELQVYLRSHYELMQLGATGTLGARLRRNLLYDPCLAMDKGWQACPLDPDEVPPAAVHEPPPAGVSASSSPQTARPGKSMNQVLAEVLHAMQHEEQQATSSADDSGNSEPRRQRAVPPRLAGAKGVRSLHALGPKATAEVRAQEWEMSLLHIPPTSEVWKLPQVNESSSHGLWVQSLADACQATCDDPRGALEAARLLQLLVDKVAATEAQKVVV